MEELWQMLEDIEILNLQQQKGEETIWCQKQIIILQCFIKTLLTIEMRETQILMNKPVYLGISILDLSKIVTCVFLVLLCKTKIS